MVIGIATFLLFCYRHLGINYPSSVYIDSIMTPSDITKWFIAMKIRNLKGKYHSALQELSFPWMAFICILCLAYISPPPHYYRLNPIFHRSRLFLRGRKWNNFKLFCQKEYKRVNIGRENRKVLFISIPFLSSPFYRRYLSSTLNIYICIVYMCVWCERKSRCD